MKIRLVPVVLYLLVSALLCAQVAVPDDVYRSVDAAIAEPGSPRLKSALAQHSASPWYPRLENYVLKRSRQFVIQNDLDQAKAASLAVIDVNLDNREAVELYQAIQAAIVKRDEEAVKAKEREAVAAHKQQIAETKAKEEVAKTYRAVTNPTTGKKVYLDQDFNTHYRQVSWDVMLGLATVQYVTEPERQSTKYGISASAAVIWRGEDLSAAIDGFGDGMLLGLSGDPALNWSAGGLFSVASNNLTKRLFLRGGYMVMVYDMGSEKYRETSFATPIAGVGIRDVPMGEGGFFNLALDWYAGHLFDPDVTFAMGASMGLMFVLADMPDFDIHFLMGARDTVLVLPDGLKNDIKVVLAIGVGNHE